MKSRERVLISRNAILNASITQHRQPADNQTPNSTATSRWLAFTARRMNLQWQCDACDD
jgi:hypothetical protein